MELEDKVRKEKRARKLEKIRKPIMTTQKERQA